MKKTTLLFVFMVFSGISFAQNGENPLPFAHKEPIYDIAPSFPGGQEALYKFISDSLRYPEPEKSKKLHGYVMIKFVVSKKGKIENIQPVNGVTGAPNFVKESIRLLESMPLWVPASKNKKTVEAEYTMNITFKLPK